MAATRKLQGEIDRCLKKVAEGVETFEDIWKKVHNATNSNQKQKHLQEKYEADLKKEIKKLQRLRDQIKSWIASAEIKDKSALLENRRLIETQMERFKVVERETKTKAYSKEGLGAAQKMDPAQRIKDEARNWLTSSISSLQIQIDQYESEIESLLAGKKKRLDRDKQERMDDLRSKLDRHKFHVTKLETLLRLLDNDGVEAEQVNKIKDDVEYYIDSSQEPDFEENEFIYDDIIGLDEVELSGTGISLGIPSSATTDSNNSNETSGSPSSVTSGGSPSQSPVTVQHQPSTQAQQQLQQLQQSATSTVSSTTSSTNSSSSQFQQQQQSNGNNSLSFVADATLTGAAPTTTTATTDTSAPPSSTIGASSDKRTKSESTATNKIKQQQQQQQQPIKPIAVRAKSVVASDNQVNKIISSTPSKNQQQITTQPTAASIVASSAIHTSSSASSTGSNSSSGGSGSGSGSNSNSTNIAVVASGHNPAVQPHAPAPSLNASSGGGGGVPSVVSSAAGTTAAAAVVAANNSNSNIQGQSVIQATPTIAFAAVAKHNTSALLENGPVPHSTTPTVASIVGASGQAQQQQQTTQLSNLQSNSSHLQNGLPVSLNSNTTAVDAISLKTMAQEAINRSVIDTNTLTQQAPNIDTRQQQQQQQSVLQQHFSADTTANQQQQQQQSAPSIAAAVAAVASTNGPSSVSGLMNLTNVTGQSSAAAAAAAVAAAAAAAAVTNAKATIQQQQQQQQLPTSEAIIPPMLGVAPLGPSPLHKDHQLQFQLMEAAFYHLPQPQDTEKMTTYFHRSPVQTPPHYPQSQLPIYDTVEFYQRLSTETLFFVFYYMEGSKAQYLAAKALKKQSWRFHTKYMMWFQRHEEPKIINDDYEQGTYIYFDYEKWSQRKKEGFTFEYKYLEDKELN